MLQFEAVEGRPECLGIEIRSGEPLTTTALRDLRFGDLIESKRSEAGRKLNIPVHHERKITDSAGLRDEGIESDLTARLGRPPVYPPEHYVKVAEAYLEAKRKGWKVYPYVARRTGTHPTKDKHKLSKWIGKAAQMGLLEEHSGRGRLRGGGKR